MTDLDVLNELLNSSPRVRRTVKSYILKAHQRGRELGQREGRAAVQQEFDELLERVGKLGHMNGSTDLFKAKWQERRDKGGETPASHLSTPAEIDRAVCEYFTANARPLPVPVEKKEETAPEPEKQLEAEVVAETAPEPVPEIETKAMPVEEAAPEIELPADVEMVSEIESQTTLADKS